MTGIYWSHDEARIKKYGATTSGSKTVVRVELEVQDHLALGSILSSIERAKSEQDRETQPARPTRARRTALAAPVLRLTHHRGDSE